MSILIAARSQKKTSSLCKIAKERLKIVWTTYSSCLQPKSTTKKWCYWNTRALMRKISSKSRNTFPILRSKWLKFLRPTHRSTPWSPRSKNPLIKMVKMVRGWPRICSGKFSLWKIGETSHNLVRKHQGILKSKILHIKFLLYKTQFQCRRGLLDARKY